MIGEKSSPPRGPLESSRAASRMNIRLAVIMKKVRQFRVRICITKRASTAASSASHLRTAVYETSASGLSLTREKSGEPSIPVTTPASFSLMLTAVNPLSNLSWGLVTSRFSASGNSVLTLMAVTILVCFEAETCLFMTYQSEPRLTNLSEKST